MQQKGSRRVNPAGADGRSRHGRNGSRKRLINKYLIFICGTFAASVDFAPDVNKRVRANLPAYVNAAPQERVPEVKYHSS